MKFKYFMLLMLSVVAINYLVVSIKWLNKEVTTFHFIDKTGKTVLSLPLSIDRVESFYDGRARIIKEGKRGFIDKTGKVVIPTQYDKARDFVNGLAIVEKNGKVGGIDTTGKLVIPLEFEALDRDQFESSLQKKFFVIRKGKKYGLIHYASQKITIPPIYDAILYRYNLFDGSDLMQVQKNGKLGLIQVSTGKVILPLKYHKLWVKKRFTWCFKNEYLIGLFDNRSQKMVLPLKYTRIGSIRGYPNLFMTERFGQTGYGLANSLGDVIAPAQYNYISTREGVPIKMTKNGRYGFLSKTGEEIVPPAYQDTQKFLGGFAAVKQRNQWGFIDTTGKVVVPPQYDIIQQHFGVIYIVAKDGQNVVMSLKRKKNRTLFSSKDSLTILSEGLIGFRKGKYWGVMDTLGQVLIPPQFTGGVRPFAEREDDQDKYDKLAEGWVVYQHQGKWGIINPSGQVICKPLFDLDGEFRFLNVHLIQTVTHNKTEKLYGLMNTQGAIIAQPKFRLFFQHVRLGTSSYFVMTPAISFDNAIVVSFQGQVFIPESKQYERIDKPSEGLMRVRKEGMYGYINQTGKLVTSPKYPYASDYSDGLALVFVRESRWRTFF
ncbi:MAG TPA: hypothetical protein DCS93_11580 [Microscillaceae bacterium]|nr:hypothetical protein [Microscillaceae bacterium]